MGSGIGTGNSDMIGSRRNIATSTESSSQENIQYIIQMLGELRQLADAQNFDMLCYFLEMAYLEANEVQLGSRSRS